MHAWVLPKSYMARMILLTMLDRKHRVNILIQVQIKSKTYADAQIAVMWLHKY